MVRPYLQLARIHTAPLETIPAIVAAMLVTDNPILIGAAGLFGLLYHVAGYSHNSYSDWRNGYDKDDEHKQHHPLNTGALSPRAAKLFVMTSMLAAMVYGVTISLNSTDALAYIGLAVIAGVYYNEIGKETYLKFIPISFAHTSTFAVPYLAFGGAASDITFIYGVIFVFLWVVYQISVSGEVKDLDSDEENFLKYLGLEHHANYMKVAPRVEMYSMGLRVIIGLMGALTVVKLTLNPLYLLPVAGFTILSIFLNDNMMRRTFIERHKNIRDMAIIEFCSMGVFVAMLSPVITAMTGAILIVISFIWVRVFNGYLWGTSIAPRV